MSQAAAAFPLAHFGAPGIRSSKLDRSTLLEVLKRTRWRKGDAAAELSVEKTTIYNAMRLFGIPLRQRVAAEEFDFTDSGQFERRCIGHHVKLNDDALTCPGKGAEEAHGVTSWEVYDNFRSRTVCQANTFGSIRSMARKRARR